MYAPQQPTIPTALAADILYRQRPPTDDLQVVVHCFWELRTVRRLQELFIYKVVPDACIDLVFDVSTDPGFTGGLLITPGVSAEAIELGKNFAYVGVRFLPGVWHSPEDVVGRSVEAPALGSKNLMEFRDTLAQATPTRQIELLADLTQRLYEEKLIRKNVLIKTLLDHSTEIGSVEDIIRILGYSRRQAFRIIKEQTGFNPHDFLKILRFQQALATASAHGYADQSHFIREFRRVTGMTPGAFRDAYK